MLYFRKVVLLALLAVYLIFCPLLILYAFGRIAKPGKDANGLIFLSTNPPGAKIFVEGRRFTEKTPAGIKGMLPGTYDVTVTLEGYKPWHNKIQTFPNLASVFDKIILVPENWKAKEVSKESFLQLVSLPGSRFFILNKGSQLSDYYSFDSENEELTPFIRPGSNLAYSKVIKLYQVEESSQVVLEVRSSTEPKYLLVNFEKGYVSIKDISQFFPTKCEHILWDPAVEGQLFTFSVGNLNKIDLSAYALEENYLESLKGYGLFNHSIYVLKDINTLLRLDYNRSNQRVIFDDPILGNFLFGQEGFFEVKPLDDKIIFFIGSEGKLVSNLSPNRWVEKGVRGLVFHQQTKRALFWLKDLAAIIDYRPLFLNEARPTSSALPKRFTFYTKGKDITQSFWAYQGAYAILTDVDRVLLFEIKDEDEAEPNEVVKISKGSAAHYQESLKKLYYLDPVSNKLYSVEIAPQAKKEPLSFKDYLSGK